ncbi:hypothetical protein KCP69_19455 [Salmonella enterica subsp. enterica]|nr:hypothetical protein KCP69_19455 [Salmonella enterica subsp. enterica]
MAKDCCRLPAVAGPRSGAILSEPVSLVLNAPVGEVPVAVVGILRLAVTQNTRSRHSWLVEKLQQPACAWGPFLRLRRGKLSAYSAALTPETTNRRREMNCIDLSTDRRASSRWRSPERAARWC